MRVPSVRLVPLFVSLTLLSPGCYYITQGVREAKELEVDQDGDGAFYAGKDKDCDDNDPTRSPLNEEIPYDGIDNDCKDDGDIVDVDGDLYPGIAYEEWLKRAKPGVEWPSGVIQTAVDCVDVDTTTNSGKVLIAADIHPGTNPKEVDYDGIDADCGRDNDFDNDGDGYMPDAVQQGGGLLAVQAAYEAYVSDWGYEAEASTWFPGGTALYGDCEDNVPDVNPGNGGDDQWFDGIDSNCDGVNDFDPDGDGFMPPTYLDANDQPQNTQAAFQTFVNRYNLSFTLPEDVSGPDGAVLTAFDDCLERFDPRTGLASLDPASIYPRDYVPYFQGDDLAYDGIDTDCWADDDFDLDGDGYPDVPDAATALERQTIYDSYFVRWDYPERTWLEEERDCYDGVDAQGRVDGPAGFATNPGALEVVGDGVDQDCDGDERSSAFSFRGSSAYPNLVWTNPRKLQITRADDTYAIGVAVDLLEQYDDAGASFPATSDPVLLNLQLEDATSLAALSAQPFAAVGGQGRKKGASAVASRSDCRFTSGANDYAILAQATAITVPYINQFYVPATSFSSKSAYYSSVGSPSLDVTTIVRIMDDCSVRMVMAGENYFVADWVEPDGRTSKINGSWLFSSNLHGSVAYMEPEYEVGDDFAVVTCKAGDTCKRHFLGVNTTQVDTYETWDMAETRFHDDGSWSTVLVFDNVAELRSPSLAQPITYPSVGYNADTILDIAGYVYEDTWYLLVLEDVLGEARLKLIYQELGSPVQTVGLQYRAPIETPDAVPTEVALHVDDDRIAVVVAAITPGQTSKDTGLDTVGWLFLGPPQD